jgi:hypothetical protein
MVNAMPRPFYPLEKNIGNLSVGGCVDLRAGADDLEK